MGGIQSVEHRMEYSQESSEWKTVRRAVDGTQLVEQ